MHVARVRSVHGGREYVSVLLRQSYREDGKVKHRTLASLTALPPAAIDALERALRGETLVPAAGGGLRILRSLPHGHVAAALGMLRALGLERTLDRRSSRMRDLAVALIVARILAPASKLATARGLSATTLAADAGRRGRHRGRAVRRARLAAGPPAGRRAGARAPPSRARRPGAARCQLHLDGGPLLSARGPRLLARPPGRPAPGGVRPADRRRRLPGGRGGVPGEHRRPGHARGPAGQAARPLRPRAGRARGRPGDAHLRAHRAAARARRHRLGERPAGTRHPGPRGGGHAPAVAVRRAGPRRDQPAPTSRASGSWSAATRCSRRSGRASARSCSPPPRSSSRRIAAAVARGSPAGRRRDRSARGPHPGPPPDGQALRARHRRRAVHLRAAHATPSPPRRRSTGSTSSAPAWRPSDLDAPGVVLAYKRLSAVERDFRALKTDELEVRPIHHWREDRVRAHLFLCMLAAHVRWHLERGLGTAPVPGRDATGADRCGGAAGTLRRGTRQGGRPTGPPTACRSMASAACSPSWAPSPATGWCWPGSDERAAFEILAEPTPLQARALALARSPSAE